MNEQMPLTPPYHQGNRVGPPSAVSAGNVVTTPRAESHRLRNILIGTGAVISLGAGVLVLDSLNEAQAQITRASEKSTDKTPTEVAEDCKDPSDTEAMMFGETGKPVIGLEVGKEYSPLGVVSAVSASICTEVEAVKYWSELHPAVAFGTAVANANPDKPLFDQIDSDPVFHDEVARAELELLSGERETVVMGDQQEATQELFTLRFDPGMNATYAQSISPEEANSLAVVRFTQNNADTELDRAGVSKFLVLGTQGENGQVVITENSGSILTTVAGLDGCIVLQPTPAEPNTETTLPTSAGDTIAPSAGNDSDAQGNRGRGGGSRAEDGQTGECSSDNCDGGTGHDDGEACDNGCDHTPTRPTVPPTVPPTQPTVPPTRPTVPPTVPPTQPTSPPPTSPPTTKPKADAPATTLPTTTTPSDGGWG